MSSSRLCIFPKQSKHWDDSKTFLCFACGDAWPDVFTTIIQQYLLVIYELNASHSEDCDQCDQLFTTCRDV